MSELNDKIKEIIVDITTDHDTDTLEEVMDVYVGRFVDAAIQSLPKGGQVPEDIRNSPTRSAIYKNGWSDCDKAVFTILTEAKSPSPGIEDKAA